MDCSTFLSRFSELRDGPTGPGRRGRLEGHRSSCPSCARYARVLDEGVRVLRESEAAASPEFPARLRHRLFHVRDGGFPGAPEGRASGAPVVTILALGALAVLAAWSPVLQPREPAVRLPAIVVEAPADAAPGLRLPPGSFFSSMGRSDLAAARAVSTGGLPWDEPAALLLEYSPLLDRDRPAGRAGAGHGVGPHRP